MEIGFEVEWTDMTDEAREFVRENAAEVCEAGAILLRDEIVAEMDPGPPRSGRKYFVPGTQTKYTASAPGQPPAVREGLYRESWQFTPAVPVEDGVAAYAYTSRMVNGYVLGDLLEYGTVRMRPRPHIRPAMARAAEQIRLLVEGAL